MSEPIVLEMLPDRSIRVSGWVHRKLLAIQYQRKMAGESVSFSEIIGQLLDRAGAA